MWVGLLVAVSMFAGAGGCGSGRGGTGGSGNSPARLRGVRLEQIQESAGSDEPIKLAAARNEWASFTLQLEGLSRLKADPRSPARRLRVQPLNLTSENAGIETDRLRAYQVLPMPVDVNRAGYIRHTGQAATDRMPLRALLPLPLQGGTLDLSAARDPEHATDPGSRASTSDKPLVFWFDVHVPPEARAGEYETTVDLLEGDSPRPLTSLRVRLTVHNFVLPDQRHLAMVGQLNWEDLVRLHPERFEAITPRLMNRTDARYASAVRTLDQLVALAQENRTQVVIPRLQPTVKWPAGRRPDVDWTDYDSIVTPWLKGDVFSDRQPVTVWPLPSAERLESYDAKSQREYWGEAATHFDSLNWLTRAPVVLRTPGGGRPDSAEALKLSGDAAQLLALNDRLRVEVPLEDDQVQFASAANPNLVPPASANRLITANPGLVFNSPIRSWPAAVARPARWLRTDLTGIIPYVGAGADERDVRLWAWFASVPVPRPEFGVQYGPVQYVRWPGALPKTARPSDPADPNELIWFYPGSWFGIDQPVPTIQLKWLRRAQQDFEYLYLARERGETINALVMARLLSKPVELQPNQPPDPTYGLMSGTADPAAWDEALRLVARHILLREPGQPVDERARSELGLQMVRWAEPQERPVITGRTVAWFMDRTAGTASPQVAARLGIDIYNAADRTPDRNLLAFSAVPQGWHHRPQPTPIDELATYHVARFTLDATIEPTEVRNTDRRPLEITFTDGFTRKQSVMKMVLPVAHSDRREGKLTIDGSLEDWTADDAVQDGPLVRMFARPSIQKQELVLSTTPANVYTGWADENFYVAFRLTGLLNATDSRSVRNFVTYQFARAWGEDLAEMLLQAVYADGSLGPVLHVVCKPTGHWVERKMDPKLFANPWQAFEGTGLRYAATIDGPDWRGEVAIPWRAISDDPAKGRPVLLRFNFTQHKTLTGESATWAGPVDFGRDENLMGVLILREPSNPGMGG